MIDLTSRIIQPATITHAPNGSVKWHGLRRMLQLLCGILLVALPLTNGLRLDLRKDEFYFAWHKMAAHDLFLLFWVAMLGTALLTAVSFLYGRLWCGWVCPQTLASDFADSLKRRLDKALRVRPGAPALALSRTLWAVIMLGMSVGTGIILADYWLAPTVVLAAAARPWTDWTAAAAVYGIAGVLAADLLWIRRQFCAHACPYGALMGTLADQNTLAVRYLDERDDDCIQCGKCVTDCPMGIDIKQGVGQLDCIGCGECVDACNDVLGRRGKAGLIEFRYGIAPERQTQALTGAQRWGLWDARRWAMLSAVPISGAFVLFLIVGRLPLTANLTANGAITRSAATVRNTYTLSIGNGLPVPTAFTVSARGLRAAQVEGAPVTVAGHDGRTLTVTVAVPTSAVKPGRAPIQISIRGGGSQLTIPTIFYTPPS